MAGAEPVEVQALASWSSTGVDQQLVGTLRFESGLVAQFDCALTIERREQFELAGTDGRLELAGAFLPGTGDVAIVEQHGRADPIRHLVSGADEYQLMVEHFAESVLDGKPVRYPPEEAARNLAVIEALYRSARRGGIPEPVVERNPQ
jgi:predicted dehydrogenase